MIQKYARGYLVRTHLSRPGPAPILHGAMPVSPELCSDVLGVPVVDGRIQPSEERMAELMTEARSAPHNSSAWHTLMAHHTLSATI